MASSNFARGRDAPIAVNLNLSDDDDDDDEEDGVPSFAAAAAAAPEPPSARAYATARVAADPPSVSGTGRIDGTSILEVPSRPTGGAVWDQQMIDLKTRGMSDVPDEIAPNSVRGDSTDDNEYNVDSTESPPVVAAHFQPVSVREPSSLRTSENNNAAVDIDEFLARKRNNGATSPSSPGGSPRHHRKPGLRNSGQHAAAVMPGVDHIHKTEPGHIPSPVFVHVVQPAGSSPTPREPPAPAPAPPPPAPALAPDIAGDDVLVAEATLLKPSVATRGGGFDDESPPPPETARQGDSSSNNNNENQRMLYLMGFMGFGFLVVVVVIVIVAVLLLKPNPPAPTLAPTPMLSSLPTPSPTEFVPTTTTSSPTAAPTTLAPTKPPTLAPTESTEAPTTAAPTESTLAPTILTEAPTSASPTVAPTSASPTVAPTSASPTVAPTPEPTLAPVTEPPTPPPTTAPVQTTITTDEPTSGETNTGGSPGAGSGAPTATPAPGTLVGALPAFTQVALENPDSAQSRALSWIERHPRIDVMEIWKRNQLFAMATFYYSYDGDSWNSNEQGSFMSSTADECEWGDTGNDGNECNADGRITRIALDGQTNTAVRGTTPPELILLADLNDFGVYTMDLFTGFDAVLPPQLTSLTALANVRLSFDSMSGTIPDYLHFFQQLTSLNVRENDITGSLPTELGLMTNLKYLTFYKNSITGTVPSEIGLITSLESLLIYGNDITGTFPSVICELPLLLPPQIDCKKIVCPETCCECKDPAEDDVDEVVLITATPTIAPPPTFITPYPTTTEGYIFGMPSYTVETLQSPVSPQSAAYEWLLGHPDLDSMEEWRQKQLFALATFYYSFNGRGWDINEGKNWLDYNVEECEWGETTGNAKNTCDAQGRFLSLSIEGMTGFVGTGVPPELALISSLEAVKLYTLEWEGNIADMLPSQLAYIPLHTIFLQRNVLTGNIPSVIGTFWSLANLNVIENQLTGTLPTELGLLQNLQFLNLYDNLFTGQLPSELGMATRLQSIQIDRTDITGTVPSEICALPELRTLRLNCDNVICPAECGCTCYVETR